MEFNFVCPVCQNVYSRIQAFASRDIENFKYFGLVPLKVGEDGKFLAENDNTLPIVAFVCLRCGHITLFHAGIFEETLRARE